VLDVVELVAVVDDVDDDGSFGVENFGAVVVLGKDAVVRLGVGVCVGVGVGVGVGVDEAFCEHHPSSPQNAIGVQHWFVQHVSSSKQLPFSQHCSPSS
jgi:hypothetical protein